MAALRDQARLFLNGRPLRIEEGEPLEDSVRTVHAVMKMQAERGGEPTVHNGVKGLKKHMNLTRIVQGLTMDLGENDRKVLARLISQVFRQTGAAVCLRHADPSNRRDPVWFVANEMSDSLIVVVNHVRGRSAGTSGRAPTAFDEQLFLRPGEKRLRPEEVGETQPAGEVTVTQTQTTKRRRTLNLTEEERAAKADEARRIFADSHAERRAEREALTNSILEFILTAPVPMTEPELYVLHQKEYDTVYHESTYRGIMRDLEKDGKVAARKETSSERLVRGGGSPVKATSPKLYGPPDGVPERTKLPHGIKPLKSAAAHADEKKRLHEALDNKVYRVMDVARAGKGHNAPRTPHMIAIAADISDREALEALERLVASGRVFYHPESKYYAPMSRVRQSTIDRFTAQPELPGVTHDDLGQAEVLPAVKAAEAVPAAEPDVHTADRRQPAVVFPPKLETDIGEIVRAEMRRIAEEQASGTPDPSDAVEFELRQRITELEAENEKLKRQVAGLRQTLAAME